MTPGQYQTTHTDLTTNDDGIRPERPRLLVVHTFEGQDLDVHRMMDYQSGRLPHQRTGSYHVVIDAAGQSGRENDNEYVPWAAAWTGNRIGLHASLSGQAAFTRDQWLARSAQLEELARWLAHESREQAIPLQKVIGVGDPSVRGVCGHGDISQAYPRETNHTDPGPGFPWDHVLSLAAGGDPRPEATGGPGSWHVVQPGETLTGLSRAYGTSIKSLVAWNTIPDPDRIRVGQVLRVRPRQ